MSVNGENGEGAFIDLLPEAKKEDAVFRDPYRRSKLEGDFLEQIILERKSFADRSYHVTIYWLFGLAVLVIAQYKARLWGIGLKASEFIALVTTTSATILGFWWLVGRSLYDRKMWKIFSSKLKDGE